MPLCSFRPVTDQLQVPVWFSLAKNPSLGDRRDVGDCFRGDAPPPPFLLLLQDRPALAICIGLVPVWRMALGP